MMYNHEDVDIGTQVIFTTVLFPSNPKGKGGGKRKTFSKMIRNYILECMDDLEDSLFLKIWFITLLSVTPFNVLNN